jgi:hypothetical protein
MAAAVATVLGGGTAAWADPAPADLKGMQDTARKMAAAAAPTDERAFGDMTGDGKADLLAVAPDGNLYVYPGRGVVYSGTGTRPRGYFDSRIKAGSGWNSFEHLVRHGDWNNDGKQDVLAVTAQGWLVFYAGTGKAAQPVANGIVMGYGWTGFDNLVGIGDGNGDGFDDLIARKNGILIRYEGTGMNGGIFRKHQTTAGSGWNGSHLTSVGDWTGDGVSELVFRNTNNQLWLYTGRPGSGFPANSPSPLGSTSFGASLNQVVGMGNLTSDAGRTALPDLVFTDIPSNGLWAIAPDTSDTFDGGLGYGWGGYQLF